MATVVAAVVISVALSLLAARIFAPDPIDPAVDDTPTTLSKRGAFVPLLFGRRRTGPVFCWAGDRRTREEPVEGGGGGKGGGGSSPKQTVYSEGGWHAICVGPIYKLHEIRSQDGKELSGTRDVLSDPSGFTISTGNGSSGRFYWGTCDQPIDSLISSKVGIASKWPHLCHMVWDQRELDTSPIWPSLDYDVESRPQDRKLFDSEPWLDFAPTSGTQRNQGWNPAHALYAIMTATYPHGLGIDPPFLDCNRFELAGQLFENEKLPVNLIARNGVNAAKLIADMLQDVGMLIPQIGDLIAPWVIRDDYSLGGSRPNEVVPTFDASHIKGPPPEIRVKDLDETSGDRLLFRYPSVLNDFKAMDLVIDDDAQGVTQHRRNTQEVEVTTVTHPDAAALVTDRRQLELLAGTTVYQGKFFRDARLLSSGQRFKIAGVGTFRTLAVERTPDDNAVALQYMPDAFSDPPTGYEPDVPDPIDQVPDRDFSEPTDPDVAFDFFELPCTLAAGLPMAVFGVRARANAEVLGSTGYGSADLITYSGIGTAGPGINTGTLDADFDAGTTTIVEDGPILTRDSIDEDLGRILDLSANENAWLTGRQGVIIGDEWFYLRNITIVSPTQIQLHGLVRAREDTKQEDHSSGDRVWILTNSDVSPFTAPAVVGQTVGYKSRPYTDITNADLSAITAVTKAVQGRSTKVLPVSGLRTEFADDGSFLGNAFIPGADVELRWNYRVCNGEGVAAGDQVAGTVLFSTVIGSEGEFILQIWNEAGDTMVRQENLPAHTTLWDYETADRTADFAGEPDAFEVRVYQVLGGIPSEVRTMLVGQA